jgi:hypothetical protein
MKFSEMLEKLARIVPGVSGYQDKEATRDTDKTIRLRLADGLEELKRDLENEKRHYMETKDLSPLPELDRLASKLDKLGNLLKFAGRGYRGFFDTNKHDQEKLDQLYTFDLGLFDQLKSFKQQLKKIQDSRKDAAGLKEATQKLHQAFDRFEKEFKQRQEILIVQ